MQPKPESPAEGSEVKDTAARAEFKRGKIEGVVVKDLRKFVDERGWLAELFRDDETDEEYLPAMAYVSTTLAGVQRGPHEHVDQADYFCFIGPSNFKMRLWDNRAASPTFGNVMTLFVGEDAPKSVIVPKGVVHAYRNVGQTIGVVINLPNRLYAGEGRREEVDEIRHEDDPGTVFRMDD
ncbi:MAG TPA: dTDP-4-dehydrorhamnose 3,5-epimerase family protein [Pyrinomonadaceae bacterium]|jgi:dTDP-4-dehydrorhamnose 3,5-epimerase|nr:dTDP-4-dehydrorhamnose 3,5-epimerase family protein [Pyrinomonadaceae bacterium]